MVWKITIIDNRGIDKNSLFRRSAEIALELLDDRRLLRRLLALGPDKHQPEDHADEEQLLIRIRFFDAPRKGRFAFSVAFIFRHLGALATTVQGVLGSPA